MHWFVPAQYAYCLVFQIDYTILQGVINNTKASTSHTPVQVSYKYSLWICALNISIPKEGAFLTFLYVSA